MAVSHLRAALQAGRVSHAYLFHGPEGTGRELAAFEFAKAINCEDPDPTGDACDRCLSCRRMDHRTHPDFHSLELGSKGGENVGIEQVRQVLADVALRPTAGRRKVYIVPSAHRFSPPASHTILKTLEEPPPYVTLILIAPEVSDLLPTVVSRCQLVRFHPLGPECLEGLLAERGIEPATAHEAASLADGSFERALALALTPEALDRRLALFGLLRQALTSPRSHALRIAEDLQRLGAPPKDPKASKESPEGEGGGEEGEATRPAKLGLTDLLDQAASWFRDLLALKSGAPLTLLMNRDQAPSLEALAPSLSVSYLAQTLESLQQARHQIDRNANPRLVLEVLVMRMMRGVTQRGTDSGTEGRGSPR